MIERAVMRGAPGSIMSLLDTVTVLYISFWREISAGVVREMFWCRAISRLSYWLVGGEP
jgi:hypothetical protein